MGNYGFLQAFFWADLKATVHKLILNTWCSDINKQLFIDSNFISDIVAALINSVQNKLDANNQP